jgi:alanyl-tRNA synthetase
MSSQAGSWSGAEIRRTFLRFFEEQGHQTVPSSSLIPANDPTLLFTNAGMNQFKEVFLGRERRAYSRACSSQKCLRVSGKHNDLEQVGRTPRHHTFFEMLGNFSFGDYFKSEAIPMAWELMTRVYGLDPARLWITVFREDEEAFGIWTGKVGLSGDRVLRMDEADNFWSMGETGPCGPCSEIHIDRGVQHGCGRSECGVGCSCDRFMELWNLVFIEFDRQKDGSLRPLAARGVDTGMGLERIASVLQGVESNYDTDLLRKILEEGARLLSIRPGASATSDVSLRVIADHVRAVTFLIADGVIPTNDGRGYVLRRILRRAIRHGRMLETREPFLHRLTGKVVEVNADAYPALAESRELVGQVCLREEERFASTLSVALTLFDELVAGLREKGIGQVPGPEAFRLYDTFGLPLDLMVDEAESLGFTLDRAGFDHEMEQQRARARKSWKGAAAAARSEDPELAEVGPTRFLGYDRVAADGCRVLALRTEGRGVEALGEGERGEVLLDATPFYAEAGGQVGDMGWLTGPEGRAEVLDCRLAAPGVRMHTVRMQSGRLRKGDRVATQVDVARRAETARHHTATHLLHAALREVVGTHVKQAGSLVAPDHLRFDFSHFAPVTLPLANQVEDLVNEVVLADVEVTAEEMSLEEALATGAMALFGEKYGERVRVIRIGDFSTELCGGTHAGSTGELGLFKITGERGVSSGVRRVEALSGQSTLRRFREDAAILSHLQQMFNVDRAAIPEGVERLVQQNRVLSREAEKLRLKLAAGGGDTGPRIHEVLDVRVLPLYVEGVDKKGLRELADRQRGKVGRGVVALGTNPEPDRGMLLVAVSPDLAGRLDARAIVGELAREFDGRGGGKADLAEAGGRSTAEGIRRALEKAPDVVLRQMEASR